MEIHHYLLCWGSVGLFGTILTFSNGTNLLADPSQAIFWTAVNQQAGELNHGLMYLAFAFILVGLVPSAVYSNAYLVI